MRRPDTLGLIGGLAAAIFGSPASATASAAVAQYGHVLFITDGLYGINAAANPAPIGNAFGGLLAADLLVTQAAANAGLVPGWNGQDRVFKALLSSATENARDRVAIQAPVYNTVGQQLANDHADLWDGTLSTGVQYSESRHAIPPLNLFWTGSDPFGVANATAGNWTQTSGQANIGASSLTSNWFSFGQINAATSNRLAAIGPRTLLDPGDLDSDKDVDGGDFLLWQRGVGRAGASLKLTDGDANGDLAVNTADLDILKQNFGRQYGAAPSQIGAAMAVPEPSSLAAGLIGLASVGAALRHQCQRTRRGARS
jgi:hypothetical protein